MHVNDLTFTNKSVIHLPITFLQGSVAFEYPELLKIGLPYSDMARFKFS